MRAPATDGTLRGALRPLLDAVERASDGRRLPLSARERGTILSVEEGAARVSGLSGATLDELVRLADGRRGTVFNLDPDNVGVILLDQATGLEAGQPVERTGRVLDVPVGDGLLGRIVDALGRPRDDLGRVEGEARWPVQRPAPGLMARAPVAVPLQTGLNVVDALVPIGRGQRELIVGDRETGKTAIALDAIINQRGRGVVCLYCAIGKRNAAVAKAVAHIREHATMAYCVVVVASGDDPPGLQYVAPYAATTMGEFFMSRGKDVLIVFDDLTRHARAYRELSLLLRRPPGREAYPGDIFHIHARLLERCTRLREEAGGGSLSALPIVETQAQNIAAYIPTNLVSITDGQVYLSPDLFRRGVLPAVDVGRSVSRVGGDAQLAAYRGVAADLRLAYSQFQELERFARFATQLDEATIRTLEHGRRVREVLKQAQGAPVDVPEQVAVLLAVTAGYLDDLPLERVGAATGRLRAWIRTDTRFTARVNGNQPLDAADRQLVQDLAERAVAEAWQED